MAQRYKGQGHVELIDGANTVDSTFETEYQARQHFNGLVRVWTENAQAGEMPANRIESSQSEFRIVNQETGATMVAIEVYFA